MTQRQRFRLEQLGVAVVLSAAGLIYGIGLLTRLVDSPSLAAVVAS